MGELQRLIGQKGQKGLKLFIGLHEEARYRFKTSRTCFRTPASLGASDHLSKHQRAMRSSRAAGFHLGSTAGLKSPSCSKTKKICSSISFQ